MFLKFNLKFNLNHIVFADHATADHATVLDIIPDFGIDSSVTALTRFCLVLVCQALLQLQQCLRAA